MMRTMQAMIVTLIFSIKPLPKTARNVNDAKASSSLRTGSRPTPVAVEYVGAAKDKDNLPKLSGKNLEEAGIRPFKSAWLFCE